MARPTGFPAFLGEVTLLVWLLTMGVNSERRSERAAAAASVVA